MSTASFAIALDILETTAATVNAAARMRKTYEAFKAAAERDKELTPEESASLDEKAEIIFASESQKESGR